MEVAGANRRWRFQFRYRGSRRESAVADFSHSLTLQPTPVGRFSSAFAVDITHPAWFSSGR